MPTFFRYAEDFTGTNPDNKIQNEEIQLTTNRIRAVVPKYGPFFVDSLVVFDKASGRRLDKDVDYKVPFLSPELGLRTGKPIADAYLIVNEEVSSTILETYQTIGGNYQNNIANIVAIYESFLQDDRMVDFVTGLYGVPNEFPPTPHPHFLADIYHFEPLVYQLERIVQSINLSNAPAFQNLVDSIFSNIAKPEDIQAADWESRKFITIARLMDAARLYNFNTVKTTPVKTVLDDGDSTDIAVDASNMEDGTTLFWTIEHGTTDRNDFTMLSGTVPINAFKGSFTIQLARNIKVEPVKSFRVALRLNGPTGTIIAKTQLMTIRAHGISLVHVLQRCYISPTFASPAMPRDLVSMIAQKWSRYENPS